MSHDQMINPTEIGILGRVWGFAVSLLAVVLIAL